MIYNCNYQHHILDQLYSKDILNLLSINKYFYSLRYQSSVQISGWSKYIQNKLL